jgi:hypothetical protein
VPDIRIEIPRDIKAQIADMLTVEQSQVDKTISDIVTVTAHGAVGKKLSLKESDFWVRVGEVYANAPVVFVDITMLKGKERTKKVRKKLATAIAEAINKTLNKDGPRRVYVLVWVDNKDRDGDYAEIGPDPE